MSYLSNISNENFSGIKTPDNFSQYFPVGKASAYGHHGELIQGMFMDDHGKLCRGLVSLPCPEFSVNASYEARLNTPLTIVPSYKKKALYAAKLTLDFLQQRNVIIDGRWGGVISLESNIPEGYGLGSSTADVVAAIRVVARTFVYAISSDDVAVLAVKAESASDPIMFDESDGVLLFAQREARVLEKLGRSLPALKILGVNTAPENPVSTNDFPPAEYDQCDIQAFSDLRIQLRTAVEKGDVGAIGQVATASAQINQKFLPTSRFAELLAIGQHSGAVGIQVAHSGTVAGLLFDAKSADCRQRIALARIWLSQLKMTPLVTFEG